jgi:hypothetical protein
VMEAMRELKREGGDGMRAYDGDGREDGDVREWRWYGDGGMGWDGDVKRRSHSW